jgi:hypothetical protein
LAIQGCKHEQESDSLDRDQGLSFGTMKGGVAGEANSLLQTRQLSSHNQLFRNVLRMQSVIAQIVIDFLQEILELV